MLRCRSWERNACSQAVSSAQKWLSQSLGGVSLAMPHDVAEMARTSRRPSRLVPRNAPAVTDQSLATSHYRSGSIADRIDSGLTLLQPWLAIPARHLGRTRTTWL